MPSKKKNKKKYDKEKINFRYNFKRYWELIRDYKGLLIALFFSSLIAEAAFVGDKFLFKRLIDDGSKYASGNLSGDVFINTLIVMALMLAGFVITASISEWFRVECIIKLYTNAVLNLKRKYFNHLVGLSHRFHTTHKSGKLISRIQRGDRATDMLTGTIAFNFTPLIFQLVVVSISLAMFTIIPALIIILTVIVFISYSFFIQQKQQDSKIKSNQAEDKEKAMLSDIFTNIDTVKYFGKENKIKSKFFNIIKNTRRKVIIYENYFKWFDSGQALIIGAGTFFIILIPILQFLEGEITIGTVAFTYTVYGNLIGPMHMFVNGMRAFYRSMGDMQELFNYDQYDKEIKDKPNAKNLKIKHGSIEFSNVRFSYGNENIFNCFNLYIKPNTKVALVGRSGSGKTTLVKLLYRLYDVQGGEILIDNKNITDYKKESLRNEMSIVPQEPILFDDTIYNNIKFSNPSASRKEVMKAIRSAQLDRIIKKMPKKEHTIVGERGVKLSGGEKQRVSIARALLANKKVLVLDEATSSLDSETEFEIQEDLRELMKNRTSIMIAHRLSTIMNADMIVVMKDGNVIQKGTHNELMQEGGEYKRLWDMQRGGYVE